MNLRQENKIFILKILDYEFKDSNFNEDLNWLNIEIWAQDDYYKWSSKGPFLRVSELKELYNWFNKLENNENEIDKIDFLENEISFQFLKKESRIIINLDFSFHPKKQNYIYGHDHEYKLSFDLNLFEIYKILKDLEQSILKFPERVK
jgi:hypothetical protein